MDTHSKEKKRQEGRGKGRMKITTQKQTWPHEPQSTDSAESDTRVLKSVLYVVSGVVVICM